MLFPISLQFLNTIKKNDENLIKSSTVTLKFNYYSVTIIYCWHTHFTFFLFFNFISWKKSITNSDFLSISVIYIKEEVDCDELSVKKYSNTNDIKAAKDALNVKGEIGINNEEGCEAEVIIKEEPQEYDLVCD